MPSLAEKASLITPWNPGQRLSFLAAGIAILIATASCSADAQEQRVRKAMETAFPDGPRRCLPLPNEVVGNHVATGNAVLWYPSDGPTAPTRHMSVFWAGRETEPVPDLVGELAKAGILRRSVVEANTDAATQWLGPAVRTGQFVEHPTQYGHERGKFKVAIYESPLYSADFRYADAWGGSTSAFPSRVYDGPLPPADQSYLIPLTTPYAVSVVAAACLPETIDEVTSVETKTAWAGVPFVEAKVVYKPTPPAWMRTPAFSQAAIGPNTLSITATRRATLVFTIDGDKLVYVREDRP